jgi:hypothetical protein
MVVEMFVRPLNFVLPVRLTGKTPAISMNFSRKSTLEGISPVNLPVLTLFGCSRSY